MAGNCEGARKTVKKILARDPDFYRRIGQKGGRRSTTGGFACSEVGNDGLTGAERAKVAGAIGGRISRRGVSKKSTCVINTDASFKPEVAYVKA